MLKWSATFFVIAIIAAIFGFTGIASGAAAIAKVLFFFFIVLFLGALVAGGHNVELAATVKTPLVKVDDTFNRMVDPVADPEIVVPTGLVQV